MSSRRKLALTGVLVCAILLTLFNLEAVGSYIWKYQQIAMLTVVGFLLGAFCLASALQNRLINSYALLDKIEKRDQMLLIKCANLERKVSPDVATQNLDAVRSFLPSGDGLDRQDNPQYDVPRPNCWNRADVLERVEGDEELLQELCDLFLAESPKLVEKLVLAIATANFEAVKRAAHSLKGEVGYLSATAAAQAARKLEDMGHERNLAGAAEMLMTLEVELQRLRQSIENKDRVAINQAAVKQTSVS